jgi:hypothetical protein
MRLFHIREELLPADKCQELINLYQDNIEKSFQWRDTFPLYLEHVNKPWVIEFTDSIVSFCNILESKPVHMHNKEIVRWPTGSFQRPHYDRTKDVFGSITYLNDDFEGGRTFFNFNKEIVRVSPEIGKTIVFTGAEYEHFVEKVESGTRYTLACWLRHD